MSRSVIIKLETAGFRTTLLDVSDDQGTVYATNVPKEDFIAGQTYIVVDDAVEEMILESVGVCNFVLHLPIQELTAQEIADITYTPSNSGTLWKHLVDVTVNNKFYNITEPYIIEYPFMYQFHDEILQNVKDYTRAFKYLPIVDGVYNDNAKIQTDDQYFNKVILYNGQQCSGLLKLVPKPYHNLSAYLNYPIYNTDSKTIIYTKSDSFYQYNTFWNVLVDKAVPMFFTSCESLSIDKVLNQANMNYGVKSFRKETFRAKGVLVRHILDDRSDAHLVSQFVIAPSQISYK